MGGNNTAPVLAEEGGIAWVRLMVTRHRVGSRIGHDLVATMVADNSGTGFDLFVLFRLPVFFLRMGPFRITKGFVEGDEQCRL